MQDGEYQLFVSSSMEELWSMGTEQKSMLCVENFSYITILDQGQSTRISLEEHSAEELQQNILGCFMIFSIEKLGISPIGEKKNQVIGSTFVSILVAIPSKGVFVSFISCLL